MSESIGTFDDIVIGNLHLTSVELFFKLFPESEFVYFLFRVGCVVLVSVRFAPLNRDISLNFDATSLITIIFPLKMYTRVI